MNLQLSNPIVFFDLETTGLSIVSDRIVEMSCLKLGVNGEEECLTLRFNPTIPISSESTSIHGISNDEVKDCPTFKEKAKEIAQFFSGCDMGGYNSIRFDLPLLAEEFLRAGVDIDLSRRKMVDVQNIFHKMEKRTLEAAYQFYCGKDLIGAHGAEADTRATYEVLKSQLDRYDNLENDVTYLAEFSRQTKNVDFAGRIVYNAKGEEVINFGKHKGKSVSTVLKEDQGYYAWILKADFPLSTKKVFTEIKLRELNTKA